MVPDAKLHIGSLFLSSFEASEAFYLQSKLFFNFSNGLAYFDGKKLENIVSNKTQPDNSLSVLDKTFCVGHSGMHPLETSKLSSSDTLSHGIRIKQEIFINHEHVEDTF